MVWDVIKSVQPRVSLQEFIPVQSLGLIQIIVCPTSGILDLALWFILQLCWFSAVPLSTTWALEHFEDANTSSLI